MAKKNKPSRAQLIHAANKYGLTLQSYKQYRAGNTPLALAERSPRGIRAEAQRLTKAAYDPVNKQLDEETRRINSVAAKRESDNMAFAQWVGTQTDALKAQAIGQASAVNQRLAQGQSEFATQLQGIRDSAAANLQRQGVSSGDAVTAQVAGQQAGAQAATQATTNAATARTGSGMDATLATLANNPAVLAASRAKDFADILGQLGKVADSRQKVVIAQAQDHARNLQNLLQQEITKAQATIAAGQFTTKEANDLAVAGGQQKTTRLGQTKSQKGQNKRAGGQPAPVPSYTRQEWNRHSSSWRQRKLKEYNESQDTGGAGGKPSKAATRKARAKAQQDLSIGINIAKGTRPPKNPPKDERPEAKPGNVKKLAEWLIAAGLAEAIANIAAQKAVYPKKPMGAKNRHQYDKYVDTYIGSR